MKWFYDEVDFWKRMHYWDKIGYLIIVVGMLLMIFAD